MEKYFDEKISKEKVYEKTGIQFMLFIIGNMAMNIAYFGFMGGSDVEYAFYIKIKNVAN